MSSNQQQQIFELNEIHDQLIDNVEKYIRSYKNSQFIIYLQLIILSISIILMITFVFMFRNKT